MKDSSLSLCGLSLLLAVACGSDGTTGTGKFPAQDGGATGGAAGAGGTSTAGGATGTQCRTTSDCPQLGCYMCPASVCVDGRCVPQGPIGGGGTVGSGGSGVGDLKWYATCGPPVCSTGTGGSSAGVPFCTSTQTAGATCTIAGAQCDSGNSCVGPLLCTTTDPTNGGACPKSRAKYKTDIEYLSNEERSKLADDVQSIPLVHYRYKDGPEREHLGFIIEDVEPSPGVDSAHDRVDLYGYASMAVAALQEQHREIEALKREIATLRAELAGHR